jgi:sirohydrochlorin cobaltochelatase
MTDKTAVMICGHGSRDVSAIEEFGALARHLKAHLPGHDVESGFLEFARPMIRDGLEALKHRGATRIACLPGMLFAAGHVKNDLPSEVNDFAAANPGIDVRFGRDLAIDAKLLRASADRIAEAERRAPRPVPRQETLLMVVGRGTNDSDANSNVAKVARMLWEGLGFGWAEVSYSGVAHPRVDAGLARAVRLGFKRIIVFPYFLFTGILVKRIYTNTDTVAAANPDIEFLKADYLNDHPLVIECFLDRVAEVWNGAAVMNCQLCKYRERIIGYEGAVGEPQAGHHHHVRGIGTDADHGHHHDHHPHDHGHHHHHGHDHDHDDHHHGHDHAHADPHEGKER